MTGAIVRSVRMPNTSPGPIRRERLIRQLEATSGIPFTLVRAPAGWGKSALLETYASTAARSAPVIRLSGDAIAESDLLARLDEALQNVGGGPQPGDGGPVRRLIAAADAAPRGAVVLLDGYHRITDLGVLAALEQLVLRCADKLRLILACRTDPDLPLHRWRVNGAMAEIRTEDLAFTVDETSQLLASYAVDVSEARAFRLHASTEGWAAALRLAAMSLRTRVEPDWTPDEGGYLAAVADYLTVEVLDPLPADLKQALLDTSVVDRMSAGLVEWLTGRRDGSGVLTRLRAAGLFLSWQAGPGGWYRSHPLVARTLYAELRRRQPERVPDLHRRAAAWHGAYGLAGEALRQSLLAGQWHQATELVARHWTDLAAGQRGGSGHGRIPTPPGRQVDAGLALALAAERLQHGDLDATHGYLRVVERDPQAPGGGDRRSASAAIRLAEESLHGDPRVALDLAGSIVDAADAPHSDESRALVTLSVGRARLRLGRWDQARESLQSALALAEHQGMVHTQISAGGLLSMLDAVTGQLRSAAWNGRQVLSTAERFGLIDAVDLAWARLALAEVFYQWDRVADAGRIAEQAFDVAGDNPDLLAFAEVIRAKLRFAAGEVGEAMGIVAAAQLEFSTAAQPLRTALALTEAELRVATGDFAAAGRLLADQPTDGPLVQWTKVATASVLYGEGKLAAAAAMANAVLGSEPSTSLTWRVQAALLVAQINRDVGNRDGVLRGLESALVIVEREGVRRPFIAGGHPVRELLASFAPMLPVYHPVAAEMASEEPVPVPAAVRGPAVVMLEPLTERELTVLRYLQGTMSNDEIATTLYVSVNTVKTHIKNIYRKLSAGRRREAVRRARELRLL